MQGLGYEGAKVISELLSVVKAKPKRKKIVNQFVSKNGFVSLQIQKRKDKKIEVVIDKKDNGTKADIIELLNSILDSY